MTLFASACTEFEVLLISLTTAANYLNRLRTSEGRLNIGHGLELPSMREISCRALKLDELSAAKHH